MDVDGELSNVTEVPGDSAASREKALARALAIFHEDGTHQSPAVFTGEGLKVGGEGMRGFYDKILVDAANKLGKQFGAKVGRTRIQASELMLNRAGMELHPIKRREGVWEIQGYRPGAGRGGWVPVSEAPTFSSREDAEAYINRETVGGKQVHSLDITPQMRESVMQGQPVMQR